MQKNAPKKRGRKPKGGKIIKQKTSKISISEKPENIILHLSCKISDLSSKNFNITPYDINNKYSIFKDPNKQIHSSASTGIAVSENSDTILYDKLKELQYNLHINNNNNKKSACFCCTYNFDTPIIYIPKDISNNKYNVYGCFCSPECATYYLFNEKISTSVRSERYSLLNLLYNNIYKYEDNIMPAPNPHYMLDKFLGNLTISEYRKLLRNKRFLYINNKPLTNILPELHFDYISNANDKNTMCHSSTNIKIKKKHKTNKNSLLSNNFNLHTD